MSRLLMSMFVFAVAICGSAQSAYARVCFHDVRGLESVKAQLPAFMQSGEVYGVHSSFTMKGAFRIVPVGARLLLEAKGRHMLAGSIDDNEYLKAVCVSGAKLQVWLLDGRYDELTIDPKGLKFYGYTFKLTDRRGYQAMMSRL